MKKIKLLAFISAVITAVLLFVFLNSLSQTKQVAKSSVVRAIKDIPENTPITAEMITLEELPNEAVISGAIRDISKVMGKVSEEKIFTGEQMLSSKLISAGDGNTKTLAYAIQPGLRAITIPVDITSGVANMIIPGNHIDLIGQFLTETEGAGASGAKKRSYATMILENITVLAVDSKLSENEKNQSESKAYTTLTLEVTPRQALELSMAQFEGQIRAILRSPIDEEETKLPSVSLEEIMVNE